ncbi:MAG: ABC transporter ATP-binding protein [Oscillospiraceae bacterium]|nr:ABC transporter ATP-binding protein [Oscillospiraceae bacterium]
METNTKPKHLKFFGIPKILPFLKNVRGQILMMVALAIVSSLVDITIPQFQRYALDTFVGQGTLATIIPFVVCYVAVILLAAVVNYISCAQATIVEMKVNRDLRQTGFQHLQTLSFSYFNQNSVGYIHARLMSDTGRIGGLVSWWLIDCTWRVSYLVGAVIVMLRMNARLALMVLTTVPVLVVLFAIFQKKLEDVNHEVREINSKITGNFNEGIMGAKTVKSLAIEEEMESRFTDETENMRRKSIRASRLRGLFAGTMNFASSVALAIVLWKGGYIALEELGTFSVFMSYAQGMMEPLRWLVDIVSDLITTQVNIQRFTDLLAVRSDVVDTPEVTEKYGDCFHPKKENWEPIKGDIEFKDVTFRYPDGEETVLENFSLKIPFGSHIAIVGETGAGKSTLVNLVCRFYEPTQGQLLIDGRDARERSQLWLHSAIGYVLQTPHLFSGSVRENLLMGNPNATQEQIWDAIRTVSADEVIAHLEKGLDTDVGEGGDLLSTGEKQLISFARAILADPRILILDEATASVDTMTEAKIQAAMEQVTKGRTCLMIAHRLSTVRNADLILVVKNGRIVEQGSHTQLLAQKGYYRELYTRQYEDEATAKILA